MNRKVPQLKNIKLDIGCGANCISGFTGMDIRDCGQEIIWDARQGIPFPDSSVETVFTSHFIEHLDDDQGIDFIQECMRVLKPKGELKVRCPHVLDPTAFYFGHKSFWNEHRVEALNRMTEKIEPFMITENRMDGRELKFILKKL